jgi:hypothetical protein
VTLIPRVFIQLHHLSAAATPAISRSVFSVVQRLPPFPITFNRTFYQSFPGWFSTFRFQSNIHHINPSANRNGVYLSRFVNK